MTRRLAVAGLLLVSLACSGCLGPVSLHKAVLGYDHTVSWLGHEILLVNIGRLRNGLPVHFTQATSIAATFDYQTNAAILGPFSDVGLSVGVTAAENPTLTIMPIQRKQFTERVLTPLEDTKFEFPVFQGTPIDLVMRLLADGIEVQTQEGTFARFILNWPTHPTEYEEFRRIAMHLAWLNANRRLFVGRLSFLETTHARLSTPPSAADIQNAFEKDFRWAPAGGEGVYALERHVIGRVVITNYDARTLSDAERQALNTRAGVNPGNFVLVDIHPSHPGGNFPLFGAVKLRSLNMILSSVAADHGGSREYDVTKDSRTGDSGPNPRRTLGIEITDHPARPASLRPLCGPLLLGRGYPVGPPGVQLAVPGVPGDCDRRLERRRTNHNQQVDPTALDTSSSTTSIPLDPGGRYGSPLISHSVPRNQALRRPVERSLPSFLSLAVSLALLPMPGTPKCLAAPGWCRVRCHGGERSSSGLRRLWWGWRRQQRA
jgi:hypothetical protein